MISFSEDRLIKMLNQILDFEKSVVNNENIKENFKIEEIQRIIQVNADAIEID